MSPEQRGDAEFHCFDRKVREGDVIKPSVDLQELRRKKSRDQLIAKAVGKLGYSQMELANFRLTLFDNQPNSVHADMRKQIKDHREMKCDPSATCNLTRLHFWAIFHLSNFWPGSSVGRAED